METYSMGNTIYRWTKKSTQKNPFDFQIKLNTNSLRNEHDVHNVHLKR